MTHNKEKSINKSRSRNERDMMGIAKMEVKTTIITMFYILKNIEGKKH